MSANVVKLERLFRRSWDWSPHELAEFYRVESALIQAGLRIDMDRGLSDEGDPWFAFCRSDDGEVIVHIARIGGVYILAGPSYDGIASGGDIAALVRDLVSRHPLIQMRGDNSRQGSKIFLHPAALLIAVVATAFFKSTEARALNDEHRSDGDSRGGGVAARTEAARSENISVVESQKTIVMDAIQSAVVLSAMVSVLRSALPSPIDQDVTTLVASASGLLDLTASSSAAPPHPLNSASSPIGLEVHQFEPQQDAGGHISVIGHAPALIAAADAAAHVAIADASAHIGNADASAHAEPADALPLIAILWDLPATAKSSAAKVIAHEAGGATMAATPTPVAVQSPILTFKMALSDDANGDLPAVQSAKLSYSGNQGTIESHAISNPDQLPASLLNALKDSTHTTVDTQPSGPPNSNSTSFADALILSLTNQSTQQVSHDAPANHANAPVSSGADAAASHANAPVSSGTDAPASHANAPVSSAADASHPNGPVSSAANAPATHATLDTSMSQSQASSSTEPADPAGQTQTAMPNTLSSAQAPPDKAGELAAQVQDFFNYTPSWASAHYGNQLVVYDTTALANSPSDLKSISFDFSDGSTLSLVGLPAALPHQFVA